MRSVLKIGLAVVLGALLLGCGARTKLIKNENAVLVEGLFEVWGQWVKDKGRKLDLKLTIANDFNAPILIRTRDVHCSRGERWGEVHFIDRHRSDTAIHVHPGRSTQLLLVCQLAEPVPGDIRVLFSHVFEDPHDSMAGVGELLASDIEWMVPHDMVE